MTKTDSSSKNHMNLLKKNFLVHSLSMWTRFLQQFQELKPFPIIESSFVHVTFKHSKQQWLAVVLPVGFMRKMSILIDTLATSLTTFANEQAYWLFPALFYSWIIQFYFVHTTSLLTFFLCDFTPSIQVPFCSFYFSLFSSERQRIIFLLFSLNTIAMWFRDNFLSYLYLVLVTLCSVPSSMCCAAHLKHIKELFQ